MCDFIKLEVKCVVCIDFGFVLVFSLFFCCVISKDFLCLEYLVGIKFFRVGN